MFAGLLGYDSIRLLSILLLDMLLQASLRARKAKIKAIRAVSSKCTWQNSFF